MLSLGVQMYGCMPFYNKDPEGVIAFLSKAGYKEAEPCIFFGEGDIPFAWKADNLTPHLELLSKYGMTVSSAHGFAKDLPAALPRMIEVAKELGLKAYVTGFNGPFDRETVEAFAEKALIVAEGLAKEGIELWLHNNSAEIAHKIDGISYYEWILKQCGGKLGAQVDTGWVHCGGENLADFIAKNASFIRSIHHKDVKAIPLQGERAINLAIGDGAVDSKAAFAFAKENNLGQIVDQDTGEVDLLSDLAAGFAFLQKLNEEKISLP